MGSALDIGQMLQKKQMASPFLRNGDLVTRRQGETETRRNDCFADDYPVHLTINGAGIDEKHRLHR